MDFYVYYKVAPDAAAALAPRVKQVQQQLAASHGVATALKRRPGQQNGMQTWMEVYPRADARLAALVEERAAASGMAALIDGPRRAEVFVEFTCA